MGIWNSVLRDLLAARLTCCAPFSNREARSSRFFLQQAVSFKLQYVWVQNLWLVIFALFNLHNWPNSSFITAFIDMFFCGDKHRKEPIHCVLRNWGQNTVSSTQLCYPILLNKQSLCRHWGWAGYSWRCEVKKLPGLIIRICKNLTLNFLGTPKSFHIM